MATLVGLWNTDHSRIAIEAVRRLTGNRPGVPVPVGRDAIDLSDIKRTLESEIVACFLWRSPHPATGIGGTIRTPVGAELEGDVLIDPRFESLRHSSRL